MNSHYYTQHRRRLYRSRRDKVFSGLCGGMANHFGISPTWTRVGFIIGALLTFPIIPIIYLICAIMVPLEEVGASPRGASWREENRGPSFRSREEALDYLNNQFDRIEDKVRRMEDHVTSREYVLRRKFENL